MISDFKYFLLLLLFWGITSCGVKRFIPSNERLLKESSVQLVTNFKFSKSHKLETKLQDLLRPVPNTKIFGARLGLLSHYKNEKTKTNFVYKYLNKKIGEPPVYASDVDIKRTEELILNRLENSGFYNSKVSHKISQTKHFQKIDYKVALKRPYILQEYKLDTDTLPIYKEIKKSLANTFLKEHSRYELSDFISERERIDKHLKNEGYYNFNPDFLIFEVDTNQVNSHKFNLHLRLKKEVPQKSIIPYIIKNINVFPNYSIENNSAKNDTVVYKDINFIQDSIFFKPKRLAPYILFKKGGYYNSTESKLTSNRLASIGTYKYVNIQFDEKPITVQDTIGYLEANILLSPLNKRAVRIEVQAVSKSSAFIGPSLSITHNNRNLFKGGETLSLTGRVGYEKQIAKDQNADLGSMLLGLKANLLFPRLLSPIKLNTQFKYAIPKTQISTNIEYYNRSELYTLNSYSTSFGYTFNANTYVFHELNPISINLVRLTNTTNAFNSILNENPFLRDSFEQEFIAGLSYSFTYNESNSSTKRNPIFFNSNIEFAGNTLDLLATKSDENGTKSIFGLEFAQFAKIDVDFRYNFRLRKGQTLVSRLFGGLGVPYGNSTTLPFSKQFFSGGPYSVRGFRTRSLGPGSYTPTEADSGSFFDQSGDIRIEANLEYRFPLYSYLKGALFTDVGNVWLLNENKSLPGGKFSSKFTEELAVSIGAGVRFDIQGFVIRFDLATPIRKPFLPKGNRFNFDVKDSILNFAIGYPF